MKFLLQTGHFKTFLSFFAVTVILTATGGVARVIAAPGDLDPYFGAGGKILTTIGANASSNAVAVQADGKIVVVGSSGTSTNTSITVVRYTVDGALDTTFDGDGIVTLPLGPSYEYASDVALQSDGKIVVVGSVDNGSNDDFAVKRLNTDGSPDTSFAGDGILIMPIGTSSDNAYAVAVQSDGKIVVAGGSRGPASNYYALVRFESNGILDGSLEGDGVVLTPMGEGVDGAFAIAIQADGKIVVCGDAFGTSSTVFSVVRYQSNGSLDTNFDGDGKAATLVGSGNSRAVALAVQPNGKILAAGSAQSGENNPEFALVRYNENGALDTSFEDDGKVLTPIGTGFDGANSVAIQSNGKIVAAGSSFGAATLNDFAVARYLPDGSLDTTFDGDGKLTTVFGNGQDSAAGVAIQPNGKIIAVGSSYVDPTGRIAVSRYVGDRAPNLFDYDGDGRSDVSVFRPGTGAWYINQSALGLLRFEQLGSQTDKLAPADYDGDGKTDVAVFRPSEGNWFIIRSSDSTVDIRGWGSSGDVPAPGDFDGDGRADLGVFRAAAGQWWIDHSGGGSTNGYLFGQTGDLPMVGNFDGDNKDDISVYRPDGQIVGAPNTSAWLWRRSSDDTFYGVGFGFTTDKIAPADYDGDGQIDPAIMRPTGNESGVPTWYILKSTSNYTEAKFEVWGIPTDIPTPADYDGDGKADVAIYRPADGQFWILKTTGGFASPLLGQSGDVPTQRSFYRDN